MPVHQQQGRAELFPDLVAPAWLRLTSREGQSKGPACLDRGNRCKRCTGDLCSPQGEEGEEGFAGQRERFPPGRIVWARVEGHEFWPARIVRRRAGGCSAAVGGRWSGRG